MMFVNSDKRRMNISVLAVLAVFVGTSLAKSVGPRDNYEPQKHINEIGLESDDYEGVPSEYKNPYPYIDNVWGSAIPADVQTKARTMEWEHNQRLRKLTEEYHQAVDQVHGHHSLIYNFTAAHILAPYERKFDDKKFEIKYGDYVYNYGPMETDGLKYLNPPYIVADYKNMIANLTLPTLKEIHLKGDLVYGVNGQPSKHVHADVYTKHGGTNFTAMLTLVEYGDTGYYKVDLEKSIPRCVFEYIGLERTYHEIDNLEVVMNIEGNNEHLVEDMLFEKVANDFCVTYITHIQKKIDYVLQWNSPKYQIHSVLNEGMYELMYQYVREQNALRRIDYGQGYVVKNYGGLDCEFVEAKVRMDRSSIRLLYPTTSRIGRQAYVDVMYKTMEEFVVDFKIVLKNASHSHMVRPQVRLIRPLKFSLTFAKNMDNRGESIYLASHPDCVVGGAALVAESAENQPHYIRQVLMQLEPHYQHVFQSSAVGFSQYYLFKFLYPGYFPNPRLRSVEY